MAAVPMVIAPWAFLSILLLPAAPSGTVNAGVGLSMLLLLLVPAVMPVGIAAYAVVGERDQGTLEPVLTTPIRREELVIGKALAEVVPTLTLSYAIFGLFLACVALFSRGGSLAPAVFRAPVLLALGLFSPLLATWSIWVGIVVSARSRERQGGAELATFPRIPYFGRDGAHGLPRRTPEPRRGRGPCGRAARSRQPRLAGRVGGALPRALGDKVMRTGEAGYTSLRSP